MRLAKSYSSGVTGKAELCDADQALRGPATTSRSCSFCREALSHVFVDLGMSPLSNAYLCASQLDRIEPFYPLTVYVCQRCFLVQLPAVVRPEHIFSDYAYFSSYSESWLEHARRYCTRMTERLGLGAASQVVEIASNDGYLLQNFVRARIPALGIDPAANVAEVARQNDVQTLVRFFGVATATELAAEGRLADLLIGNNVLAHVPDINDLVQGLRIALKPGGTITMEFPHLMQLMLGNQFDTIYHEHFSYLSLLAVRQVFTRNGLDIVEVEELPTHGGSLRIYARHTGEAVAAATVGELEQRERDFGLHQMTAYEDFADRVRQTKDSILEFLIAAKDEGKRVVGYGAPAKGNTLLNYCGVRADLIEYTVDRSPHKQGLFLPGTRIPICSPGRIAETRPDYVFILPWNLRDEIMQQMADIRQWGGRFVVPIPQLEVVN